MKTEQEREKEQVIGLLFPEQRKRSAKESLKKRSAGEAYKGWENEPADYYYEDDDDTRPDGMYPYSNYRGDPDAFMEKMNSIYVQGYFDNVPGAKEVEATYATFCEGYLGHCVLRIKVLPDSSIDAESLSQNIYDRVRQLFKENNFTNLDFDVLVDIEAGNGCFTRYGMLAESTALQSSSSNVTATAPTLQQILDQIGITVRGETRKDDCINESAFDEESRCKDCTIVALSENRAKFTWYTQEQASDGPVKEFIRCLDYVLKRNNYTTPFSVLYIVESRDGPDRGSYRGTIYFDGKTVKEGKPKSTSAGESLKKQKRTARLAKKSSSAHEGVIVDRIVPQGHYDYDGDIESFYKEVDVDAVGHAIKANFEDDLKPEDEIRCYLDDDLGESDDSFGEGAGMLIQFNMYGDHDEGYDEDDPYPYDRMTDTFRLEIYEILEEKLPKMHLSSKDFFIRISIVWDRVDGHDAVTDYDAEEFLG